MAYGTSHLACSSPSRRKYSCSSSRNNHAEKKGGEDIAVAKPAAAMDLGDLNKVWEVRPLQRPGEDAARRTLEAVAEQVQPIMRKHHWKVQILSEFCPENPSLMGLNEGGGAHVKLRLRRPGRDWEFLPYEHVLDTMLHELCHIEHGPHNADFYKLWDEVREECEDLIAKGIKGSAKGFDLPGRRLGGFTRYPSPPPLRDAARGAAERRARGGPLVPLGPRRVGGDGGIRAVLSPIQAAAMAAERRMRDDQWCASRASSFGESSKMPDGILVEASNVRIHSSSDIGLPSVGSYPSSYKDAPLTGTSASDELPWECRACTLLNQQFSLVCEACGALRPNEADDNFKTWSCKFCTLENSIKLERCGACEQWRYSYGSPMSSHGPHLGT